MKRISVTSGYTILEMLVAISLTALLAAGGFEFYVKMHNQSIAQEEISYMQHSCRTSLQEITKTLRMAGYKIPSHPAFRIGNDSLFVFFSETQAVDTVLYYLEDYTSSELGMATSTLGSNIPKKLMKKRNSDPPAIFSDYVQSLRVTPLTSNTVQVTLQTRTSSPDEDFSPNDGYRTHVGSERVILRNLAL